MRAPALGVGVGGQLPARPFSRACPWPLSLLHLGHTVGCGDTKAAPMSVFWLCVCLQKLLLALPQLSFLETQCLCRTSGLVVSRGPLTLGSPLSSGCVAPV